MEDKVFSDEIQNSVLNQDNQENDYEFLLLKLKEIKNNIDYLENNFLFK